MYSPYNPYTGEGSPTPRVKVSIVNERKELVELWLPEEMIKEEPLVARIFESDTLEAALQRNGILAPRKEHYMEFWRWFNKLRFIYDFEFWCAATVKIQDKRTKKDIPFRPNKPQRRLLAELEKMRLAGIPIRIIIVKARQWGGSTLIQMYMAWLQLILLTGWHSVIVTDVENQARRIRGMYTKMAENYPVEFGSVKMDPYEGSPKSRIIEQRDCVITIGSMQKPENLRTFDIAMAHLSEVGLWKETMGKKPEDVMQSVIGSISSDPMTLVALESTAKGVGNFFHKRWLDAKNGVSGYFPLFVPWFGIENYQKKLSETYAEFIGKMDSYDWFLWSLGATLEGINWYKEHKRRERLDDWRMQSEFPSTAEEAFQSTGRRCFAPQHVAKSRRNNRPPIFIGEIFADSDRGETCTKNMRFEKTADGCLWVWAMPDNAEIIKNRYLVSVDIGGRWSGADYSVIRVFDRYWRMEGGVDEAVATWKGHMDQDLLAWKMVQIATLYGNAEIVIETNSLRTEKADTDGDHFFTVLDEIAEFYDNLYCREVIDTAGGPVTKKYGFHTNTKSKQLAIDTLSADIRDDSYVEYDSRVCDEEDSYEVKTNGTLGAVDGAHDDMVMATAIGRYVSSTMPVPEIIKTNNTKKTRRKANESTF